MLSFAPLILPYEGVYPVLQGPLRGAQAGSAILGRVTLGTGARLGAFATLRGDGHVIQAGAGLTLGRHSTVHIAHGVYGTAIGARVSVGAGSVVHACTVGDDCVIQDRVAILDGASVGAGSVLAAGSVVFPRAVLPPGQWCEGVPARALRPVQAEELRQLHAQVQAACDAAAAQGLPEPAAHAWAETAGPAPAGRAYVAPTVVGKGHLQAEAGASLWFGCRLDAVDAAADPGASPGLRLGAGCNVQDNCALLTGPQGLVIGPGSTIGHNVRLHDGRIGARVLVGMGSELAAGTVVQDDVLLAAGSSTLPDQVLEAGWLWGGRPAKALTRLDAAKRGMLQRAAAIYQDYASGFRHASRDAACRNS